MVSQWGEDDWRFQYANGNAASWQELGGMLRNS
jgi:hypothetical protein